VILGDQDAACRGSRARTCPLPGHPCLNGVTATDVVAAADLLRGGRPTQDRPVAAVMSS
jgi:hypothetical protein